MIRLEGERRRWGIMWHSRNKLEGESKYLLWDHGTTPLLFRTRREATAYRNEKWGYIRTRKDLRAEPHGWLLPKVVHVIVTWETDE